MNTTMCFKNMSNSIAPTTSENTHGNEDNVDIII